MIDVAFSNLTGVGRIIRFDPSGRATNKILPRGVSHGKAGNTTVADDNPYKWLEVEYQGVRGWVAVGYKDKPKLFVKHMPMGIIGSLCGDNYPINAFWAESSLPYWANSDSFIWKVAGLQSIGRVGWDKVHGFHISEKMYTRGWLGVTFYDGSVIVGNIRTSRNKKAVMLLFNDLSWYQADYGGMVAPHPNLGAYWLKYEDVQLFEHELDVERGAKS